MMGPTTMVKHSKIFQENWVEEEEDIIKVSSI